MTIDRFPLNQVKKHDPINKPNHYTKGSIEPIEFIKANNLGFLEGNIIKYITRYKYKNGIEDLKKAEFYLKQLIIDSSSER